MIKGGRWTTGRLAQPEHDVAYKRYLIVRLRDGWAIHKDGHHIAYAKSVEAAKKDIDLIAD